MKQVIFTKRFKKDFKRIARNQKFKLEVFAEIIDALKNSTALNIKFKDHPLKGELRGLRECHLSPDILVIYENREDEVVVSQIGSHSELF